jgi:hypothetical protein
LLPKVLEGEKVKFTVRDEAGAECPFLFADTALSKRLSALTQIMDDLKHAEELARLISSIEVGELQYSLWMSAVVTYGKCFANADGRKVKLEELHVTKACSDALSFHRDLLSLRNEFFAHAGNNDYEASNVGIILSPNIEAKEVIGVNHINVKKRSVTEEFIVPFCHLCNELYSVVEKMGEKVHEKVFEEYKSMDIEALYAQSAKQT